MVARHLFSSILAVFRSLLSLVLGFLLHVGFLLDRSRNERYDRSHNEHKLSSNMFSKSIDSLPSSKFLSLRKNNSSSLVMVDDLLISKPLLTLPRTLFRQIRSTDSCSVAPSLIVHAVDTKGPRSLGITDDSSLASVTQGVVPSPLPKLAAPSVSDGNLFGGYPLIYSNLISAITSSVPLKFDRSELPFDPVDRVKHRVALLSQQCALPLACAGLTSLWLGDPCLLEAAFLAWFFLVGPALIIQALPLMFLPSSVPRVWRPNLRGARIWRPSMRGGARGRGRGRGSASRGSTASSRGRGFYGAEPQPVECHTAMGGNAEDLLRWFKLHAGSVFHYPSFVQEGPPDSTKGVYYLQFREERERSRFLEEFGSFEEPYLSGPVLYPELRKPAAALLPLPLWEARVRVSVPPPKAVTSPGPGRRRSTKARPCRGYGARRTSSMTSSNISVYSAGQTASAPWGLMPTWQRLLWALDLPLQPASSSPSAQRQQFNG